MTTALTIALCALVLLAITAMGMTLEAYKRRIEFRERELELLTAQSAERAARHVAAAERLEQRVRVLERIATDKGSELASEIDSLRDAPLN